MGVTVVRAFEQLAFRLRERIVSGELAEGERLPSETQLAEQAGVSRSTVREALRILQEAGLVERASPRVMVVRHRGDAPSYRDSVHEMHRRKVTFRDLYEALLALEPELARLAATRADAAGVARLQAIVTEQEDHLGDFRAWSRLDEELHLAIAELSANPALIIARAPLTQVLLPTVSFFMTSRALAEHATRYHRRIVAEIEAREPELASAVTRRHVDDFRIAWEKAGLDVDREVADLGG
jgi:GntR family transcriptional repressor for pyruvate dehydrogenase complex